MKFLLIIISFIITDSKTIHQDRILKIDKNGNLIGLPKEFGPGKFDLSKNYLRIKEKEIVLPKCINYYFKVHNNPEIKLTASWYHSKDIMPYYLNFDISQKNKDYGYKVLIDLETIGLIDVQTTIKKENSVNYYTIKLDNSCLNDYNKNIRIVKQ